MKTVIAVLIAICSISFAGESVKKREVNPDTGAPIYDEDEPKPVDTPYHIRQKNGSFKSDAAPVAGVKVEKKEPAKEPVKALPTPDKKREYDEMTGYPIYDEGESPPPGIIYHIRKRIDIGKPRYLT